MKVLPLATKTVTQKEHDAWLRYFNSHVPFLTRQDSSGLIRGARPTTNKDKGIAGGIRKKLSMALYLHSTGRAEECSRELSILEMAYPHDDVLGKFQDALDKIALKNKPAIKIKKK